MFDVFQSVTIEFIFFFGFSTSIFSPTIKRESKLPAKISKEEKKESKRKRFYFLYMRNKRSKMEKMGANYSVFFLSLLRSSLKFSWKRAQQWYEWRRLRSESKLNTLEQASSSSGTVKNEIGWNQFSFSAFRVIRSCCSILLLYFFFPSFSLLLSSLIRNVRDHKRHGTEAYTGENIELLWIRLFVAYSGWT